MRLADLIEINPKVNLIKGQEYPFISMDVVTPRHRYIKTYNKRIYQGGGAKFKSGDVLFARITPCLENGKISQFIESYKTVGFGSTEFLVFRYKEGISDLGYIFYLVSSDIVKQPAEKSMSGASGRQRVDLSVIQNLDVPAPSIFTQRKIASILSAYDDLIENNTRRINILGEMAQSLYYEWFVKFRFPGHEQVNMVESELGLIPEVWEVTELEKLLDIKHGYAFKGKFFSKEPTYKILLTPGNFAIGGGFKDDKLKYYNGDVPIEFILSEGDLLVTMTDLSKEGDTLGYPAFVPPSKTLIYLHNQRIGKINIQNSLIGKYLLYYLFCSDTYRHHILATATGATVKHTAPDRIKSFKIPLPPVIISSKFESIANSLQQQIICLIQKNHNLRKTRDLLLPKLISGEIDVENLHIDNLDIAA